MLRLRQVALVAGDLAAAERELGPVLDEAVCFRDPGVAAFGLHNALYAVGDQFLEIVSPTEAGTTAGRLLDRRRGDGGYMVILQTDQLDQVRKRIADTGTRIVFEAEGEGIVGLHLHPKDVGSAILSIDQGIDPAAWPWAGTSWPDRQPSRKVGAVAAVEIQAEQPDDVAARWSQVLGRPVEDRVITLDDATIRFVPASDGRGDGVGGIDLVATDAGLVGTDLNVVGTRVCFV